MSKTTQQKKGIGKSGNIAAPVVVVVVVVVVCAALFSWWSINRLNRIIFEANASSLEETYHEVAQTYAETSKARWHYLEQFGEYLDLADQQGMSTAEVKEKFDAIGLDYTDFYLVSSNGTYVTLGGDVGYLDLGTSLINLVADGESIVAEGSMPGRENMVFYAVPTGDKSFRNYTYCAVAFGYDRATVAKSISVASYEGDSYCYIAYKNGRVAFALTNDDLHINNVLTTLEDSGLSDAERQEATNALANGDTYTTRIKRNGSTYYMSFQQAGFAGNMLVSYTKDSVVNVSLTGISSAVGLAVGGIVALLAALVLGTIIAWYRRGIRSRDAQIKEKDLVFSLISEDMDSVYILLHGSKRDILYVSPSVERILGVPADEVMENPHALDACNSADAGEYWADSESFKRLDAGEAVREERELTNLKTGVTTSYVYEVYRPRGESSDMIMLVLTDRTDEERVLQGVRDALDVARVASESKSNFLANMSHDVRTPMNAIVGFADLAERNVDDPSKVRDYIGKIQASSKHLLGLINDILDMSKIEAGKTTLELEALDMQTFAQDIRDLSEPSASSKGIRFNTDFDLGPAATVMADRVRLTQVLLNILGNATKYTPEGGTIDFGITRLDSHRGAYATYSFTVADDGIGMSKDFLENIWSPFSRENRGEIKTIQGTGLGMAITKNLVDLMGGTISVTSDLGKGSAFEVILEFKLASGEVQVEESQAGDEVSLEGLRILAAEDNALNAELLGDLLDIEGAHLTLVTDGKEAVETFTACEPGTYDFILMDVQMPIMDGYAATSAIRASSHPEAKSIPIIAMTANTFAEDIANALESGMDAHVAKPLDMNVLKREIARILKERQASDPS